jgi:hypothetical protein
MGKLNRRFYVQELEFANNLWLASHIGASCGLFQKSPEIIDQQKNQRATC